MILPKIKQHKTAQSKLTNSVNPFLSFSPEGINNIFKSSGSSKNKNRPKENISPFENIFKNENNEKL